MLQSKTHPVKVSRMRLVVLLQLALLPAPLAAQSASLRPWVRPDSAARSVTLDLAAVHTAGAAGPTLNGISYGAVQIVVPLGWTVLIEWRNADSTAAHSFVVQQEREKIPERAGAPAFPNAYSRSPAAGIAPGGADRTRFVVDQAGWYWILCGVPGHAIRGEYLSLKVDRDASGVSLIAR